MIEHTSTPEHELFMTLAADAMSEFQSDSGFYPITWDQLPITFANGPYNIHDPDVRPDSAGGSAWKPRGCRLTYRIVEATPTTFVIRAENADGRALYEIRNGMEEPVPLGPPGP